jgi:hypothetical protein
VVTEAAAEAGTSAEAEAEATSAEAAAEATSLEAAATSVVGAVATSAAEFMSVD